MNFFFFPYSRDVPRKKDAIRVWANKVESLRLKSLMGRQCLNSRWHFCWITWTIIDDSNSRVRWMDDHIWPLGSLRSVREERIERIN
jgi:hypothetical protein